MPSKELLSSIGSTRHLNKLLKSLKRGRWASTEQARDLLDKAGMQNVVPDAFTYSQAFSMDAYSCSEIKALVSGSLHMLNSVVVNSAIASCGRMGCESEARELLRLSEDNNMATCRTYNAFLSLPMTGSAAMDVWKKIPHHMKDAYTLQLLLYRLAQDGYPPPVYENLLAEARDVMTIDRQHLATAVSGCIRAGYAADGLALLSASGVRASDDKVLATCALCAYERLGMWSESLDLLQCIDEPDVVCYTVAIAACARAGKGKEAIKLWSELSSRGLTPQRQTLSSVVRACEAAGEYEEAIRILSSISDLSARADDGVRIGNKFASSRPEQITVEYRDLLCDRLELSLHESRITSSDGSIGVADHRGGRVFINHNLSSTVLPTPKLLHVLKPKPEERSAALEAIERLKGVLESVGFTCVEYGAAAAGLALPNSDVDVTLLLNGTPSTQAWLSSLSEVEKETYPHREIAQAQLLTLHRTLNETQQFTVVATGLGGRVPVVTIVHNPTSIVMDVTFKNALGCRKSIWLAQKVEAEPQLADAVRVVKHWTRRHNMCGQSKGWLGGYAIAVAMVGVAGALGEPPLDCETLCRGFVSMLCSMDLEKHCISPRLGGIFPKTSQRGKCLSIEDPIETQWDLGAILGPGRTEVLLKKMSEIDAWCVRNGELSLVDELIVSG